METLSDWLTWGMFGLGGVTFAALFVITAPYGRHVRDGFGPKVASRWGWVTMELPAFAWFAIVYASGAHRAELVPLLCAALWLLHYGYRTFLFPFRIDARERRMPLTIVAMGFGFNLWNGFINGHDLSHENAHTTSWLADPRFALGVALFFVGFALHVHADARLMQLKRAAHGYVLPEGGLFELVCQPNYFGELLQWTGFAVATWSLPALAFALYTFANLAPRALSHRRWYREKFADFPERRRAIIPFIL